MYDKVTERNTEFDKLLDSLKLEVQQFENQRVLSAGSGEKEVN